MLIANHVFPLNVSSEWYPRVSWSGDLVCANHFRVLPLQLFLHCAALQIRD